MILASLSRAPSQAVLSTLRLVFAMRYAERTRWLRTSLFCYSTPVEDLILLLAQSSNALTYVFFRFVSGTHEPSQTMIQGSLLDVAAPLTDRLIHSLVASLPTGARAAKSIMSARIDHPVKWKSSLIVSSSTAARSTCLSVMLLFLLRMDMFGN
jgi:hypothetical protein